MIPVSVLVLTRNERAAIARCLAGAAAFDEVVVVDSASSDGTAEIAAAAGARVVPFAWDGRYPKKREWSVANAAARHPWQLHIDADEEITPALADEIARLMAAGPRCAGYFIDGRPIWQGHRLRFGSPNRKLALFDSRRVRFPRPDDLAPHLHWEMEMHYQPMVDGPVGRLRHPVLHHLDKPVAALVARHVFYACWEAHVRLNGERARLDRSDRPLRRHLKVVLREAPFAPWLVAAVDLVARLGVLDGPPGWQRAGLRIAYYRWVGRLVRRARRRAALSGKSASAPTGRGPGGAGAMTASVPSTPQH